MLVGKRIILRTRRQAVFHRGQGADLQLYSILRGEHQPLRDVLG